MFDKVKWVGTVAVVIMVVLGAVAMLLNSKSDADVETQQVQQSGGVKFNNL